MISADRCLDCLISLDFTHCVTLLNDIIITSSNQTSNTYGITGIDSDITMRITVGYNKFIFSHS